MFLTWSSAMRETKRMRAAGCKSVMVKRWYGWIIKDVDDDICIPEKDLFRPVCFGDVYKSFHDCEPCPVFGSCEMKALVEEL